MSNDVSTSGAEGNAQSQPPRKLGRIKEALIAAFCVLAALFHIYSLGIEAPGVLNLRSLHLLVAIVLVPLLYSAWKDREAGSHWIDILLIVAGMAGTCYVLVEGPNMIWRYGVMPTTGDLAAGAIMLVVVLELTRRTIGLPLVIITLALFVYSLVGGYAPGMFQIRSFSLERIISFLFSMDGLYGIPIGVSSTYVYLFILFGAMLKLSKAGDFYIDLSYSLAGRARGGPAKVSVFASALFGTISGTGIANVVTTGQLTIPLMKRAGFSSRLSAAIESVASTGGQIMPPIMGAGAFLMAEFIRLPYGEIVIAATIPAFLYFLSVYLIIDFEAAKRGLHGLGPDQLPRIGVVLKQWAHLLIPIGVLLYMLVVVMVSPIRAALYAMGTLLIVSWIRQESRLTPGRLVATAVDGTKAALEVITACATAGLIVGLFSLTGIGLRLSSWVAYMSGGHVIIALMLTMVVTVVLSMGLPTTAAYIVSAAILAPALLEFGIEPLQAHLFIFYFACMSSITPPVALVAIPAASIAGANSFMVGLKAFQIAMAGFIIPYMFVFSPSLLLTGDVGSVLVAVVTAGAGVWALAVAVVGYFMARNMALWLRALMGVAAIVLIKPGLVTDGIGLALILLILVLHRTFAEAHHTAPYRAATVKNDE